MIAKIALILLASMLLSAKEDLFFDISSEQTANAKTVLVDLYPSHPFHKAYVAFLGKRYPFFKRPDESGYYALIPTSYYQKPLHTQATIVTVDQRKHYLSLPIEIQDGHYKRESLRVNPSKAHFSKTAKVRIAKELKEAKKIYNTYTPKLYIHSPFILPLHSKITSAFGNKRLFNGTLKSYHSGTDFRAKTGTPIIASNRGRVVLVKNRFFAGNSVIIDHGEGIYSGYYHLSKFAVNVGDIVEKGQVIGYSGATGRVTGPHLHFTFHVGGVCVDPLQFVELANRYLL